MTNHLSKEFGRFRSLFWPIYRSEHKKVLPMVGILFLICFNYTILRSMKDAVVIPDCGAEIIPFLKVWVLLPMAILFTFIFTKLASKYSQEKVFYITVSSFLSFYALFAFVLYPMRVELHPTDLIGGWITYLGPGSKGFLSLFQYWTCTLFYVVAELWSSIVMTVLFWGFANEVTNLKEATRTYAVLTIAANCSSFFAGQIANFISTYSSLLSLPFGGEGYDLIVLLQVSLVLCCGLLVMGLYYRLNRNVFDTPEYSFLHTAGKGIKKKERLSLRKSLSLLRNSSYLWSIAMIVVGYNLIINLVEVVWKEQLRILYPNREEYAFYLNNLMSCIGLFSALIAFFMPRIISRFGWTFSAMITPTIVGITGTAFFTLLFFNDVFAGLTLATFGVSPLVFISFFGGAQNVLSKAAKYSVFDATKEMTFIPLDHESKLRGKAAIDGIGSRFGKSGGSLIHQVLFIFCGPLSASAPFVAGIAALFLFGWVISIKRLGQEFNSLKVKDKELETSLA